MATSPPEQRVQELQLERPMSPEPEPRIAPGACEPTSEQHRPHPERVNADDAVSVDLDRDAFELSLGT
jgi:hypothetical protein